MKPGDVVELKEGTLGLSGENLLAIYLDRTKRSKNYLAVVYTSKGTKEVDTDRLSRTVLRSRVDDPLTWDEADLKARLVQFKEQLRDARDRRERAPTPEKLDDRRLWELVVNEVEDTLTPEEAVDLVYGPTATSDEKGQVRQAFQSCQNRGVGYFERAEGRGERWRPYTVEEVKAVRREIEGMRKLRNRLLRVTEEYDEDLDEEITRIVSVPVEEADLSGEDHERLELLRAFMHDFVLHDTDRGAVGLAGTTCHTMDGFSLFTFSRFLAFDWLGESSTSISGAFLRFTLEAGLTDVREANELVAKRYVNLSDFFDWEYPSDALRVAERIEREVPPAELSRRRDLTHLDTYTIDPPDAKDFDDAISLESDGEDTLLYVHIADVAHYVTSGSTIDHEARKRGTSCYLPTGVLPMLPPRLADDLCSLRDDAPRPAMSAKLRVDPEGRVTEASFHESVIQVDENLSYTDVDAAIEDDREPFATYRALADRMATQRLGLTLETDELKVHIDSDKVDPHLKQGSEATRLIEQFMVAANEAVARYLTEHEVPAPYRCHPLPDRSSVRTFNKRMEVMELPLSIELPEPDDDEDAPGDEAAEEDFLEALKGGKVELVGGGFVGGNRSDAEGAEGGGDGEGEDDDGGGALAPSSKGLAQLPVEEREAYLAPFREALEILDEQDDDKLADLVLFKMLSCMGRAFYTPENIGHFGLGSTCYLHFTSPIRRYPDLITHRQLKWLINGGPGSEDPAPHARGELDELAARNSDQAWEAEQLERDLISVALTFEARTERWSGAHAGMVNGITKGTVFLSLERGVEARLHASDVPGGPWSVDEAGAMLFKGSLDDPTLGVEDLPGSNWRELVDPDTDEVVYVRLRLGDRVQANIQNLDLVRGRITCRLAGGDPTA